LSDGVAVTVAVPLAAGSDRVAYTSWIVCVVIEGEEIVTSTS
jgi:hypothetical protein